MRRVRKHRGRGAGSFVGVLMLPANVAAAPGNFSFSWSGPPECPSGDHLRAEVARILHHPVEVRDNADLSVRCRVERDDRGRYQLTIDTREGDHAGTRRVDADTCEQLADVAAVSIAILIEPPTQHAQPQNEPPETTPVVQPRVAPPPEAAILDGSLPTARSTTYDAGLAIGGGGGLLPSWSPGLGLHIGADVARVRVEAGAFGSTSTRTTIDPAGQQGAEFRSFSFYGQACVNLSSGTWWAGPCAGGELDLVRGSGFGPGVTPNPNGGRFGSLLAGATLRWLGPRGLAVPIEVLGVVPLERPAFVFSGTDGALVHEPARLGMRFTFGVEYRFR